MSDTLFDLGDTDPPLPKQIRDMHALYGVRHGAKCGNCVQFLRFKQGGYWSKCSRARQSNSAATDWRAGWLACGLFEEAK